MRTKINKKRARKYHSINKGLNTNSAIDSIIALIETYITDFILKIRGIK